MYQHLIPTPGISQDRNDPVHCTVYTTDSVYPIGLVIRYEGRWYAYTNRSELLDCVGDNPDPEGRAIAVARVIRRREQALEQRLIVSDPRYIDAMESLDEELGGLGDLA